MLTYMQQIKTSLPDDLRAMLKAEAGRREISESSVIRQALRAYLEGKENGHDDHDCSH